MRLSVFYAWQSDRPAKLNRFLIQDAAKAACERITADKTNSWSLDFDSDTQGVAGMCDIPNTILEKIARCDIFLADLSFVGRTDAPEDPQRMPNANVLFELGYAAKCLGFDVLVGVVNEAFGTLEGQVFDIKRRASLRYNLPFDATAQQLKLKRSQLTQQLEAVFRATLPIAVARRPAPPVHISGSCFLNAQSRDRGITFTVTNISDTPIPPYQLGIAHPKLGRYFMFPSTRSGALLPDQKREHKCLIFEKGEIQDWFPDFESNADGAPHTESDDREFILQLLLEDSDKVLYANKRVGRGFVRLVRKARQTTSQTGPTLGGSFADWAELNSSLKDE